MGGLGDLRDPALLDDPYPTYRRLLEHAPVSWDDQHGMWLVLGHTEVLEAFRRPETSVATAAARIRPALGTSAAPRRAPNFGLRGFASLPVTS